MLLKLFDYITLSFCPAGQTENNIVNMLCYDV